MNTTAIASTRYAQPAAPAEVDALLLWPALVLLLFGLVMVYSASIAIAEAGKSTGYQPTYYLVRHGIYLAIGLVLGVVAFQVPLRFWQGWAPWAFLVGVVLLALVLVPHIGHEKNGAQRWISLRVISFQPSEIMKLLVVLYAADYTTRKLDAMASFRRGFLPMAIMMLLVGYLLLHEPDFGAFVVIASIAFGILFLGGINVRLFVMLAIVAAIGSAILIWIQPYRLDRVVGFIDPWQDAHGKGYQLTNALTAIGHGEWFGVGLGSGVGKLFYLPEPHTDFLLAVVAEELGVFGVIAVIALFALLIQRAFAVGRQALLLDRVFNGLVALGIGTWLGVQSFINMGVNIGLLPTKGLTLPLMSYGGTGIVVNCLALAILMRVDYENRRLMRGQSA